ncbi:hypothetical protein DK37_17670 [Halomonas sp. SUBG004]|nr:hypothetical protein DK37_17670 [Halomonas sp. SUBG004]
MMSPCSTIKKLFAIVPYPLMIFVKAACSNDRFKWDHALLRELMAQQFMLVGWGRVQLAFSFTRQIATSHGVALALGEA